MPLFKPEHVNTPVLSQFSLKGKTAAVTGGAKGIGKEIVRGLAEAGADVALLYGSSAAAAEETAREVSEATGQRVQAYQCDVACRSQTADVITNAVCEGFGGGRLDVVVANAGVCANIPSLEYNEESWRANNGVNLDGVMWTAQAAGRIFQRRGRGTSSSRHR